MTKLEDIVSSKLDSVPSEEVDKQDHLSIKRLTALKEHGNIEIKSPRPTNSLVDLMTWAENSFSFAIKTKKHINRFIHNKIIIDGDFVQFCEEENIKVEPLLRDAIVSWKTDDDNEAFFMQGVFLVSSGTTRFLHCALYHKGNQNEDEISFFILVDDDNYQGYLDLRNAYDKWELKRDRNHLLIHVVDGNDIPYSRDCKWDDLFLPEELKTNIRNSVEGFLKSKKIYEEKNIPWKRGIILHGFPGCGKSLAIRTIISNYEFKPVTISPGTDDDGLLEAFAYAESQGPALLYFEDLDSMLMNQSINLSHFLNLMDGIASKKGILVIATANDLTHLKANIKDRPSRFDRKFEIPPPDADMTMKYIKKWFADTISEKKVKDLADVASKWKFSYAYLKELYISAIYNAIAEDREEPTEKDVDMALKQLMGDKYKKTQRAGIDKYLTKA